MRQLPTSALHSGFAKALVTDHLWPGAVNALCRLRRHGYTAMFAGGWVRDQFLGRPSPDIDLASNATFEQVCTS